MTGSGQIRDDPTAIVRAIHRLATDDLDLVLADLERWVAMDSKTYDRDDLDALASSLAVTAESFGLRAELIPSDAGSYLHASMEGQGDARVALLCHHDTVFPAGTVERWPMRRDGDRVNGPGVCDMKGGIAVAMHAARLLADSARFGRLELVSAPDEEERDGPPVTLGRLSGFDAVLCFECGRPDGSIVSERKGGRWMRMTAHGRGAHAGVDPGAGRNAATALCREVVRAAKVDGGRKGLTAEPTSVRAGDGINTVPAIASAVMDVRGLSERDLDWASQVIGQVEEHDGISFQVESIASTPTMERTPEVAALAASAAAVGRELGIEIGEIATGGTSDAAWTAAAGLPTIDGLGPVGDLDHTEEEFAVVTSIPGRIAVVAGLVASIEAGLLREGVTAEATVE